MNQAIVFLVFLLSLLAPSLNANQHVDVQVDVQVNSNHHSQRHTRSRLLNIHHAKEQTSTISSPLIESPHPIHHSPSDNVPITPPEAEIDEADPYYAWRSKAETYLPQGYSYLKSLPTPTPAPRPASPEFIARINKARQAYDAQYQQLLNQRTQAAINSKNAQLAQQKAFYANRAVPNAKPGTQQPAHPTNPPPSITPRAALADPSSLSS